MLVGKNMHIPQKAKVNPTLYSAFIGKCIVASLNDKNYLIAFKTTAVLLLFLRYPKIII